MQLWRLDLLKGIIETCSRHNDLVFCHGRWVGKIFVLEESRARDACGACGGGPRPPTLIVWWTCPGQVLCCSVLYRSNICGVCCGPMPPCQWGQKDICWSHDIHRHVCTPKGLDVCGIDEGGGVVVRPGGEADTTGGLAWTGHNC